jgi:RNA 2',3'-cyclic 3'-phosphodiesterase
VSVRLFVALDLPEPALRALAAFRDAAADPAVWRPLDASTFHVTLAFLGHRDEADVARCVAALSAVEEVAPPLALGRALLLPRVLTVALEDPSGGLARLQAAVCAALADAGVYQPEARPFRPHVTVGRLRKGVRPPRRSGLPGIERVEFAGGPVVLYRSLLGRGGATYEPLWTTLAPG